MPDVSVLHATVAALTDEQAIRALALVVDHEHLIEEAASWNDVETVLREAVADPALTLYAPVEAPRAGDGDVARAVLVHTSTISPTLEEVVSKAVQYVTGPAQRVEPVAMGIGALAIALLQTEVKIEKDAQGKWSFLVHKRPMRDSTLGRVITAFISRFMGPGGS